MRAKAHFQDVVPAVITRLVGHPHLRARFHGAHEVEKRVQLICVLEISAVQTLDHQFVPASRVGRHELVAPARAPQSEIVAFVDDQIAVQVRVDDHRHAGVRRERYRLVVVDAVHL